MKEISKKYAKTHNLKLVGEIRNNDMSKIILEIERLKESKKIKYYCMDFILFDPIKDIGEIAVSFWAD